MSVSDRYILGKGTFGAVVYPAIENINEKGNPLPIDNSKVTKIMKKEHEFLEADRIAKTIKKKVPSLELEFTPYRRTFRVSNFKTTKVYNYHTDKKGKYPFNFYSYLKQDKKNTNKVFLARMPYLGEDCLRISLNPILCAEYGKRGVGVYCREILKLFRIVKDIKDAGFVHADIRELNLMCNVYTGTLTIIDFDWFHTDMRKFYDDLPKLWYYSHPPEQMIIINKAAMRGLYDRNFDFALFSAYSRKLIELIWIKNLYWIDYSNNASVHNNYRLYKKEQFLSTLYQFTVDLQTRVIASETSNAKLKTLREFRDCSYKTVDSYGLAVALYKLYYNVLKYNDPFSLFLYNNLLMPMLHPDCQKRMTIDTAIDVMEKYINTTFHANRASRSTMHHRKYNNNNIDITNHTSRSTIPPPTHHTKYNNNNIDML